MSTNDEIRKARQDELARLIDECLSPLPFSGEDDLHPLVKESKRARILTALASFLAPHPVQQGEDGELLDWLDSHWHDWQKYITTDSDGWAYRSSEHSWHEANTLRAAIRAARSHSKQEGGA